MNLKPPFSKDILYLPDPEKTIENIVDRIKTNVYHTLKRRGAVIGISGGIDSSVTLALTAKALGNKNVVGLILPEQDSSPDSKRLALDLANKFHIQTIEENITEALTGFGCYDRRDRAVKKIIPEFNPSTDKFKIEIKQRMQDMKLPPIFYLTVIFPNGKSVSKLLPVDAYLHIVAASNFKQRSRMSMLYYHAEARHYAVIGTPNKHEVEQGFFVKHGDSGADIMPIANLYKTQVYQLAEYLGIPREIINRTPTTDTYTAEQTQEEFFFQLPFHQMDLLWFAFEKGYNLEEVGKVLEIPAEDVSSIFKGFIRKIKSTEYLRMLPIKY